MIRNFLDSNVLLYSVSSDATKADCADGLIAQGGWISVQVLNEAALVCRRKMRFDWERTHALLDTLQRLLTVAPLNLETHRTGMRIAERYQIGIYDSMIAASALLAGCDRLLSEDLHPGLVIEGTLTIVNPFHA